MAKIFLDANRLIDLSEGRGDKNLATSLALHQVYISTLSAHIMFYVGKISVPNYSANATISSFKIVDLSKNILEDSLSGPTPDLEDNIQLHSCAEEDCDYFLTNDKNILKMKFFGKARTARGLALEA